MVAMPNWLIALLIGSALGLVFGIFVARKSIAEKPIQGGTPARILHYLAASAFLAAAPTVLIGAILFKLPFIQGFSLAIGLLMTAWIFLMIHALFEVQAARG
jgi:hypothetical protein